MSAAYQAVNIKAPQGDGTNATNTRRFTVDNTSKRNAIPAGWAGKYVYLYNESNVEVEFYFSTSSFATIAVAGAASDAGTSAATQGGRLRANGERHVRVPAIRDGDSMFFLRICGSSATVTMELASD